MLDDAISWIDFIEQPAMHVDATRTPEQMSRRFLI